MASHKYIPIPEDLKKQFLYKIKQRKGIRGGVILESTIEAISLWIEHPELLKDSLEMEKGEGVDE